MSLRELEKRSAKRKGMKNDLCESMRPVGLRLSLGFVSVAKERELTAISTSTGYNAYPSGIPSQTIYTVLMSLDRSYERFGEHPIHLSSGDCSRILSSL